MTRDITALSASAVFVFVAASAQAATPPAPRPAEPAGLVENTATGAPGRKPPGYRSSRFSGGQGSTWKAGRESHGFQGSYGGCNYTGFAGPGGYKLNKVCR